MKLIRAVSASLLTLAAGTAMAYPAGWGSDITIYDKNTDTSDFAKPGVDYWYYTGDKDTRVDQNGDRTREDHEVEPGMLVDQKWDAEGFFQNGTELTFVGGFNYVDGVRDNGEFFGAGDLFIDVNGDAEYGDFEAPSGGNKEVQDTFGYDFVFDIDWENGTYNVFELDGTSKTVTSSVRQNMGSNPWQYYADSNDDTLLTTGSFSVAEYSTAKGNDIEYFLGDYHYAASGFDLDFLGSTDFIAHWTMSCGNDNLMGQGTIDVPEPGSIALFAMGLLGVGFARRQIQ